LARDAATSASAKPPASRVFDPHRRRLHQIVATSGLRKQLRFLGIEEVFDKQVAVAGEGSELSRD
jgi:hypothetical protein